MQDEPCVSRFFGYLLVCFVAFCADLLIFVVIVYILLETGAASASDLSYFFLIQFFFLSFFLLIAGLRREINVCWPRRVEAEEVAERLKQLNVAIL